MASCSSSASAKSSGGQRRTEVARSEIYHGFSDKASGTHEYEGDGKDTVEFFKNNSNYDELIRSMNYDERDAFKDWTAGHFMGGQMYRRFSDLSKEDQEKIRTYDKILDKSELKEGITVTRLSTAELIFGKGKTHATLKELKAAEGSIVNCKGCLSTGAASQGLTIGSSVGPGIFSKSVEYSIKIPPGKGRGMWVGDRRINPGWEAEQREFMTNRDSTYKIGKTTYDSKRKVYKVEVEMLGQYDHDYS